MHQLHLQRLSALRTLAELVEQHQLPVPKHIGMFDTSPDRTFIHLQLDDDDRSGVAAWSEVLDLVENNSTITNPRETWQAISGRRGTGQPPWIGFRSIEVWSLCDRQPAATLAGAL